MPLEVRERYVEVEQPTEQRACVEPGHASRHLPFEELLGELTRAPLRRARFPAEPHLFDPERRVDVHDVLALLFLLRWEARKGVAHGPAPSSSGYGTSITMPSWATT